MCSQAVNGIKQATWKHYSVKREKNMNFKCVHEPSSSFKQNNIHKTTLVLVFIGKIFLYYNKRNSQISICSFLQIKAAFSSPFNSF